MRSTVAAGCRSGRLGAGKPALTGAIRKTRDDPITTGFHPAVVRRRLYGQRGRPKSRHDTSIAAVPRRVAIK